MLGFEMKFASCYSTSRQTKSLRQDFAFGPAQNVVHAQSNLMLIRFIFTIIANRIGYYVKLRIRTAETCYVAIQAF